MLIDPSEGLTLFASANALWNEGFTNSKDQVDGSPAEVTHEIVAGPPLVQSVGVVMVSALTKGTRAASVLPEGEGQRLFLTVHMTRLT